MLKKYDKIYRLGHFENKDIFSELDDRIVIQEKIDGSNFRFYITKDNKLIFGSRTRQLTDDEGNEKEMGKMFKRCVDFVRETLKDTDLTGLSKYVFFGENCVKHTINYDWDRIPLFLGFDIYDTELEEYIPYEYMKETYDNLGLETVPLIDIKEVQDIGEINDDLVPESKYALQSAQDKKAEGLVFKNYDKQIFAKYVRDKFKEKNAEAFGGSFKYNKEGDTDNAEFVFKYCTNQRIEKIILKELDSGKELDMRLMGNVIRNTYEDIISEEWHEILTSNWKLDFKTIRKKIAPRCRAVLDSMIVNNKR